MKAKRVAIVGAGVSGLSTAFFLTEQGHRVTVYETQAQIGGLIQTLQTPAGLIETAANGFLNSALWEQVFKTLGLPMVFPTKQAGARYIFRKKISRWPLGPFETLEFLVRMGLRFLFARRTFKPLALESIHDWGLRCLGSAATEFFLEPGLGGIYAGNPKQMSASLVLASFFGGKKKKKPRRRGLASAPQGMGQVLKAFRKFVEDQGGRVRTGQAVTDLDVLFRSHDEVVLACGPVAAAHLLRPFKPETSQFLERIVGLPVASVALGFAKDPRQAQGFGILFPRDQGVRSLGALFSSSIFEGRSQDRLETWILGGGTDPDVVDLSEPLLLNQVLSDRKKALGLDETPRFSRIQKWPVSIPHYNLELEKILSKTLELPPHVRLVGNYLGGIGLSKILERARQVSEDLTFSPQD